MIPGGPCVPLAENGTNFDYIIATSYHKITMQKRVHSQTHTNTHVCIVNFNILEVD